MSDLQPVPGLGDDAWKAITEAEERLTRAKAQDDRPLVVGSAKELCETIAKVVIAERGGVRGSETDMPGLITEAHKLLDAQPGEGLASDPDIRQIAQGLKSMVLGLSGLRNRHGTGHGRASPSELTEEHSELAHQAALLWARWALRRLEPYIAGDVTTLVRDLEKSIFYRGDLGKRLTYANLASLPEADQRRLGLAVGRRASAGTFNVAEDGVEAIRPTDRDKWPEGYVDGVVAGLLFERDGYFNLQPSLVRELARLVANASEPVLRLRRLVDEAAESEMSDNLANDEESRTRVVAELLDAAQTFDDEDLRATWLELLDVLEPASTDE